MCDCEYTKSVQETCCPILNLAYSLDRNPNIDTFKQLVDIVTSNECRGAKNRDNVITHSFDNVLLACVKKGIKPVVWIQHSDEIESLEYIWKDMPHMFCGNKKNSLLVYNDFEKAQRLKDFFENKAKDETEEIEVFDPNEGINRGICVATKQYHKIVGECLGYPQDDIDYFCYRK